MKRGHRKSHLEFPFSFLAAPLWVVAFAPPSLKTGTTLPVPRHRPKALGERRPERSKMSAVAAMRLSLVLGLVVVTLAVDRSKFKTCEQVIDQLHAIICATIQTRTMA